MKKIIYIAMLMAATAIPALAQEQTLLSGELENGGYGGLLGKVTSIKGSAAYMAGGGGGWIINHAIVLGARGQGLVTTIDADRLDPYGRALRIELSEGGVSLHGILNSSDLIHFLGGVTGGAGNINYREAGDFLDAETSDTDYGHGTYFYIEPEAGAELNVASWFRIEAGVSYRFASGVDYGGLTNGDIAGPAGMIMLKFGKF